MRKGATDEEEPRRLPLVASPGSRGATVSTSGGTFNQRKEAQLINAFAEPDPNTNYIMVRKRPGYTANYTTGFVAGNHAKGMYYYAPISNLALSIVQGNTPVSTIYLGNIVLGGATFQFSPIMCKFQAIPAPVPLVVMGNGTGGAVIAPYYTNGLVITQIVDPNFPLNTVPGFSYLDGTLYVMTNRGYIYGSRNTDDPTVWDPLNVIRAQAESDLAVALSKQLSYVVAIKQWTTEFFYDAGNVLGSPLSPVQGAILQWGCVDANTVQEIDNLILFVSMNRTSSPQVVLLEDLHIRVVSIPSVDRILNMMGNTTGGTQFRSFVFKLGGHRFYVLTIFLSTFNVNYTDITLAYDIDTDLWQRWTDANGGYWPVVASTTDSQGNKLLQSNIDANVFTMNEASVYPSDNGSVVPVDIYTPNYDGAIDRSKMLSMMRINSDVTNGSILQMRYSDDDFQNWSNFQTFDLSIERPFVTDLGSFYRRAFHFRHQCNTDFRIKSVDLQLDIGTL